MSKPLLVLKNWIHFFNAKVSNLSRFSLISIFFLIFCSGQAFSAVQQIVIHWSTDLKLGSEVFLQNSDGTPISSGKGYNGDGCLVTLGYFDQSDDANPFLGNWIPLTTGTKFGDSSTGYGFPDGHFYVTSIFSKNSDVVEIYPSEPAYYEAFAPHPITSTLPAPGTPICIRFYDSQEITVDTKFNTVTGPNWKWPAFSSGIPDNLYLKVSNNTESFNSFWEYGYTFQYPLNPATASEPVDDELPLYNLNVNIVGNGTVSDHNASYKAGTLVELLATPNDSTTEFLKWEGNGLLETEFRTTYASMTEDLNVTVYFQPRNYSISVSVQGTGDVTISGQDDGYNMAGDVIELNATGSLGHQFSHWLGSGPESNSSFTTLTVSGDHTITAVFVPQTLDLNVTASSESHGTAYVIEDGSYQYGGRYSLSAQPKSGFSFSHWSSPTDSTYMLDDANLSTTGISLSGNAEFVANFTEIFGLLEMSMSIGGGTVSPGSGSYSTANLIAVNAIPLPGYDFYRWNDPSDVLLNPFFAQTDANLSMTSSTIFLEAIFRKKTFQVTINEGTGGNVVFEMPNGPWEYLGNYDLQAIAQPGYVFSNWNGGTASQNSLTNGISDFNNSLIVTDNIELTANFSEIPYAIEVNTSSGGQVSGTGTYTITNPPIIQAVPATGWAFSHWEGNETHLSQLVSDTSANSLINLATAPTSMTFVARFTKLTRSLQAEAIGDGKINGQSTLSMEFPSGTEISLVATPANGWKFDRWYDTGTSDIFSSSLTISPLEDLSISAVFSRESYDLNIGSAENGTVLGAGTYEYGSEISLSAIPDAGYVFSGWSGDTLYLADSTSAQNTVSMPDQNVTLNAIFEPSQVAINVISNGSGSVSGGGNYDFGENATLESNPSVGYIFEKWEWLDNDGNTTYSSLSELSLQMDRNYTITAHFITTPENFINYQLLASPVNGGIVFDDPNQRSWDIIQAVYERSLLADPYPGYSFLGWSSSPNLLFVPNYLSSFTTVRPTEGSSVTANFSSNIYSVDTYVSQDEGVVTGNGDNFSYNDDVSLTASPNNGKEFLRWQVVRSNTYNIALGESSYDSALSKITIDGRESPTISLIRGHTYEFDVQLEADDSFFLSTSEFQDDTYADEYLTGVTNSRVNNGKLIFQVPMTAPNKLFYHSEKHPYSGNSMRVITLSDAEILPYPQNTEIKVEAVADIRLQAIFQDKQHKLSITSSNGGSVNFSEGTFPDGATVSLTATAEPHYQFVRWEGNSELNGKTNPFITITLNNDENVRAIFTPVLYPLIVSTSPALSGIIETTNNQFEFAYGTEVEISIKPLSNYIFTNWSGNVENPNQATTSVIIESSTEITANLTEAPIDLTIIPVTLSALGIPMESSLAGGTLTVPDIAKIGRQTLLEAQTNEGFLFLGWFDQNNNLLSSAHSTYLTFSQDSSIIGKFQQKSAQVTIKVKDPQTGVFRVGSGPTSYDELEVPVAYGDSLTLTALPFSQYTFSKWTILGTGVKTSGEEVLELEINTDLTIEAQFREVIPQLSISVYPELSGIIPTGIGTKTRVGEHVIMAQPLSGYEFEKWIGKGIADHNKPTTTIDFDSDHSIIAQFRKKTEDSIGLPKVNEDTAQSGTSTTNWFGKYWRYQEDELEYHETLGWIHIEEDTPDSLWFWVPSLGKWFWAEKNSFPVIFDNDLQDWLLLDLERSSPNYLVITDSNNEKIIENPIVPGAIYQNDRWWSSNWIGTYWHLENSKWAFHYDLGWMYIEAQGLNSVWTWIEALDGWYWTSSFSYPYIYDATTRSWLWFDRTNSNRNQKIFYQFQINAAGWRIVR